MLYNRTWQEADAQALWEPRWPTNAAVVMPSMNAQSANMEPAGEIQTSTRIQQAEKYYCRPQTAVQAPGTNHGTGSAAVGGNRAVVATAARPVRAL